MEREWWDAHADALHVWGDDQPGAWEAGTAACLNAVLSALEAFGPLTGRVLDLGCGLGRLAIPLAELRPAAQIVGVDVSPAMLEQAHAAAAGVANVEFLQGDGRRIPAGGFDAAYSVLLFQHLGPDAVSGYMAEVARVLRPGALFVAQHVGEDHQPAFLSHGYLLTTLDGFARAAGLDFLAMAGPGLVMPSWVWSCWRRPL